MKEAFVKKKFSQEALEVVEAASAVIDRYQAAGYRLSLRQLYYQLVAANTVPNNERSYSRVGDIVADARLAGLFDWDMIEDRGRETVTPTHWSSPAEIVEAAASTYKVDKWETQPNYCEVMVEKQALEGVLEPVCRSLDVPFTANKGYSSATLLYHTGRRLARKLLERLARLGLVEKDHLGPRPYHATKFLKDRHMLSDDYRPTAEAKKLGFPRAVVFYMGDHDPSGIDMTRDVHERLRRFADFLPVEVVRLALNMEQVEELNPPENPAKMTDSRAKDYVERFGTSSWELDAVEPGAMADMVRAAVAGVRSKKHWDAALAREAGEVATLKKLADQAKAEQDAGAKKRRRK